jgi:hypothetical protein
VSPRARERIVWAAAWIALPFLVVGAAITVAAVALHALLTERKDDAP